MSICCSVAPAVPAPPAIPPLPLIRHFAPGTVTRARAGIAQAVAAGVVGRAHAVGHSGLGEDPVDVDFTVADSMRSRAAMARLVRPAAISASTSASRAVSPSGSSAGTCPIRAAVTRRACTPRSSVARPAAATIARPISARPAFGRARGRDRRASPGPPTRPAPCLHLQGQRGQRVAEDVVQFGRDPAPFGDHRGPRRRAPVVADDVGDERDRRERGQRVPAMLEVPGDQDHAACTRQRRAEPGGQPGTRGHAGKHRETHGRCRMHEQQHAAGEPGPPDEPGDVRGPCTPARTHASVCVMDFVKTVTPAMTCNSLPARARRDCHKVPTNLRSSTSIKTSVAGGGGVYPSGVDTADRERDWP